MKEIIGFVVKGIVKSKYLILATLIMIVLITSLLAINITQSGATQKELQDTVNQRLENVDFLIGRALNKKRHVGLSEEAQLGLDSMFIQEGYLKAIASKLNEGNLDISTESLDYIKEYRVYENYISIPYQNKDVLNIEQEKMEILEKHNLPYTEQKTPYNTALFTKQLFQFLFNPVSAFLLLLVFCYKFLSDERNRTFEFFQVKSLSNSAIYYGYLIPFILIVGGYIILAGILCLIPPLVTGNINSIYYPIEVIVGSETLMVPVWKWLLYIPIGWGIFVSLLLVLAICLFKQRITMGIHLSLISLPLVIAYIISIQFGFHMMNPIHLIVSYEMHLLPTHRFISYLAGMFVLLIVCLIVSYPFLKSKGLSINIPVFTSFRKQYQPKNKWKLLQFEYLKKKRKGHVFFSLVLLFGIIGGTYVYVNQQYQKLPETYLWVIEDFQNILLEQRMHWKVQEEELEMEIEISRLEHEALDDGTEFYLEENPLTAMIEEIDNKYSELDNLKKEVGSQDFSTKFRDAMKWSSTPSYKEMEKNLWSVTTMASEEQQYLLEEKGIEPWPIGDTWISHYNDPSTAQNQEHYRLLKANEERNTKYGNSSLFSIYKFLNWNIMLVGLGVFILLLWTAMSDEQRPNSSINFLATKPISFKSIYASKWGYNLFIAYSLLLISGGIIFIIGSIFGGIGESHYPILVYATGSYDSAFSLTLSSDVSADMNTDSDMFYSYTDHVNFYFEDLLVLVVKCGVLIMAQIFFLNGLFSLIGRWVKNHYVTILITLLLAFVGYFLADQYTTSTFMFLNPFSYFDTWNIVDGWKSIEANSSAVNFRNGGIILLSGGILLFSIGLLSERKKV